jgi:hypothetical protein
VVVVVKLAVVVAAAYKCSCK